MSAALTLPAPIPPPGPDRVRLAVAGALSLARFLRQVIDCGKQLLVAVRERAHTPDFPRFTQPFGTTYLPHILRRIATAIRCAVLLFAAIRKCATIRLGVESRAIAEFALRQAYCRHRGSAG